MASYKLADLSVGSREEVADRLTSVLSDIQQMLSQDGELSKLVHFRVQERNQTDKARLEKVLQYQAIDKDTEEVLRDNHDRWMMEPSTFWIHPPAGLAQSADPQVRIVGRYLQTHRDNA